MTIRNLLFLLHLWVGLVLGAAFVLIGLSGSIAMLRPLFLPQPAIQVTAAAVPALDKGLAAVRSAITVPPGAVTEITLPQQKNEGVGFHFRAPYGSGQQISLPDALTDPASGRLLATYQGDPPALFSAIADFHGHLLMRNGRVLEGWLGVAMLVVGLTGFYLWWPRRGQWKFAFGVRRKARGLRFHRELHGAAGIWILAIFLLVTLTGTGICFSAFSRAVIGFAMEGQGAGPRAPQHDPVVTAPPGAVAIGPDRALAAARPLTGDQPILSITIPENPDQVIRVTAGLPGDTPVFVDPWRGTVVADPAPLSRVDIAQRAMGRLHEAIGTGPVYWLLLFASGLAPLLFFITGVVMWTKKRRNRLAMNRPLPADI